VPERRKIERLEAEIDCVSVMTGARGASAVSVAQLLQA